MTVTPEERKQMLSAVAGARKIVTPIVERRQARLDEVEKETVLLVEDLLAGVPPLEALAAMGERRGGADDDRAGVASMWPQAWRLWDAQRPERGGLVNPYLPRLDFKRARGGEWAAAEHLLDGLDEWHPSAELAEIGSSGYSKLGDVGHVVVSVANANIGKLWPERAKGSPVRYRLVRCTDPVPPLQAVAYHREDTARNGTYIPGEFSERKEWSVDHLLPIAERVRRSNRR